MRKLPIAISVLAAVGFALGACTDSEEPDDKPIAPPAATVTTPTPVPSVSVSVSASPSPSKSVSVKPSVSVSVKPTDTNENDVPGDGGR